MRDKKKLIEAALFIAARPMTLAELYHIVGIPKPQISKLIKEMEKEYDDHGLSVRERDGFFELHIKDELRPHVEHLAPEKDFSKATLQTLSLIAYHNPVKQSFVIETRGNRAYDHIKELSGRGFIRLEPEGHTNRINITKKFLDYFGLTSPGQLKDYFSDRGIEPPDEESFVENVKKAEEKEEKNTPDIQEKKEPAIVKEDPEPPIEPPIVKETRPAAKPEAEDSQFKPAIKEESEKTSALPATKVKEPQPSHDPEDEEPELPSIHGKKEKKAPVNKKSVNIKDEPYKSPFSDVIKDND
ncbi:MAG: SMC-Scp complex subunit ScpB [archaeon]